MMHVWALPQNPTSQIMTFELCKWCRTSSLQIHGYTAATLETSTRVDVTPSTLYLGTFADHYRSLCSRTVQKPIQRALFVQNLVTIRIIELDWLEKLKEQIFCRKIHFVKLKGWSHDHCDHPSNDTLKSVSVFKSLLYELFSLDYLLEIISRLPVVNNSSIIMIINFGCRQTGLQARAHSSLPGDLGIPGSLANNPESSETP